MTFLSTVKKSAVSLLLAGLAGAAYAEPVYDADDTCNVNGLNRMESAELRSLVFNARLGDRGQGNGGEAVNANVWLDQPTGDPMNPYVIGLTCISTADEDTGGTVTLGLSDGTILDPAWGTTDEVDPGN